MAPEHHLSNRMNDIQPFYVMDLLAKARQLEAQGRSIIHLEIGEPDFSTPETVIRAGIQALEDELTHYTPAVGLTALREKIAEYYQQKFSVDVSPERIVITPGASGALHLALAVLVNPGEQVLMADPGYPCNRHFVRLLEGKSLSVNVDSSTAYQLTAELVNSHWNEQAVAALVASPSNPTGTLIPENNMRALIAEVANKKGVLLVDEIYQGLVYGEDEYTTLALTEDAFVINSFSKYFGMTGWRLGWMVVPQDYVDAVDRLAQNIFLAAPTMSQYAALEAFSDDTMQILHQRRDEFKKRRDYLLPALRDLGFSIPVEPQGAFYIYADCSKFTDDSFGFCYEVLEKAGVAITPGIDFGHFKADQHVRFAYTRSLDKLEEAVSRLSKFLAGL